MPPAALISLTASLTPSLKLVPEVAPGPDSSTTPAILMGWACASSGGADAKVSRKMAARAMKRMVKGLRVTKYRRERAERGGILASRGIACNRAAVANEGRMRGKRGRSRDRDAQGRLVDTSTGSFESGKSSVSCRSEASHIVRCGLLQPPSRRSRSPRGSHRRRRGAAETPGSSRSPSAPRSRSARRAIGGRSSSTSDPAASSPVRLFPGATLSLRDPAREFIALRDGAADLAVGSTLFWSAQVVELNLFALPWLAPEDARSRGARERSRRREQLSQPSSARASCRSRWRCWVIARWRRRRAAAFAGGLGRDEGARVVDAARHRSFRRAWARCRGRWPPATRRRHFARARSTRRRERSRRSPPRGSRRSA